MVRGTGDAGAGMAMRRGLSAGLVLVGVLLGAGCGDPEPDLSAGAPPSSAGPVSASPSPSASTWTQLRLEVPPQATTDGTPAGRLCAYLTALQPRLEREPSAEEARSVLARRLAKLGGAEADLRDAITTQLDTLTSQRCPETREAVLSAVGADDFRAALGLPTALR
ncbi:hypothetical protein [Cryptosporangium minutisporangium]|uniref:Lipoprotein n=1 Tax=Cryptosporangium minutisporangium TaxID=113569 RepID=A0ABP6T8X1_9ACTN